MKSDDNLFTKKNMCFFLRIKLGEQNGLRLQFDHQVAKVCRKQCGIFYVTHFLFKDAPLLSYKNLSWNQPVCWHQLIQFTLGVKGNISLFANQMPISLTSTFTLEEGDMFCHFFSGKLRTHPSPTNYPATLTINQ